MQGVAFHIAVDGLFQAFAEGEQVVDLFAGGDQAVKGDLGDFLHGAADVGVGKGVGFALEGDGVHAP